MATSPPWIFTSWIGCTVSPALIFAAGAAASQATIRRAARLPRTARIFLFMTNLSLGAEFSEVFEATHPSMRVRVLGFDAGKSLVDQCHFGAAGGVPEGDGDQRFR